jgi:Protein of unknown function (DUF664)
VPNSRDKAPAGSDELPWVVAGKRPATDTFRQTTRGHSLDEIFVDPNRKTEMSLRFVYGVMIQEYARHNGHADLLRESIDGRTGH